MLSLSRWPMLETKKLGELAAPKAASRSARVVAQRHGGAFVKAQLPRFVALRRDDPDRASAEVDVAVVEPQDLAGAHPAHRE